jgi:hypothetical protein
VKNYWKKYWSRPSFRRKYKNKRREQLYGISSEEFEALSKKGCAICGRKTEPSGDLLSVDHCHVSGNWRGVVCRRCNTLIAALEKPTILQRLLVYLGRKVKVDFSKIKTASFRGRKFQILWKKPRKSSKEETAAHGACDCPADSGKRIYIHPNPNHEELLDTVIHESLHAAFWDLEETAVTQCCEDLRHLLKRMGLQVKFFGPR